MTNKKRVILMGGLGNQLFQYAFALSLSREFDEEIIIDPNFAAIRLDEDGLPEISKFQLDSKILLEKMICYPTFLKRLVGLGIRFSLYKESHLSKVIIIAINRTLELFLSFYFKEKVSIFFANDNGYDKRYKNKRHSLFLGYFQSYRFSSPIQVKSSLLNLRLKSNSERVESFRKKMAVDQPLIVHVRLTDYRNEENFGIPSKKYYEQAISNQLQTRKYIKIWLFSDEPEEALQFIPLKFRSIVENVSSQISETVDTFEVMRLGKGYVLANSSFSWWGAYLSSNIGARTIFPSPWFTAMPTPNNLCPSDWLPLER